MWGGSGGSGSSGGGGGGDVMGGVTKAWVNQNYVSIEFFNRLFETYDSATPTPTQVLPNDMESTITNIKAKFGFWTEQYLSALGQGTGGGGGGASALSDLVDVTITSPTQGQALIYDGNGHWVNGSITPDLSSYATKAWVQQQGYITSSALNGYATQTWVTQQGFITDINATVWGQTLRKNSTVTGNMTDVGDIQCNAGSRIHGNGGTLYIGNANDADWVKISDMCSRQGDGYWKVYSNGSATFANVMSNGYVVALSDIRMKKVTGHVELKAETIADASAISFIRKDDPDQKERVGGIAQEWQDILPEAVVEIDKKLTMDYAAIDYVGMVSLARRVVAQQQEINDLKEKCEQSEKRAANLEKRLARLEAMFALKDDEED